MYASSLVAKYVYREWKEKIDVEEHEEDDTITYKKRDVFYFKPELSGSGLTGEEMIVIPHIFVVVRYVLNFNTYVILLYIVHVI